MAKLNKTDLTLRVRRGLSSALSSAYFWAGEFAFATDTRRLYIGANDDETGDQLTRVHGLDLALIDQSGQIVSSTAGEVIWAS